MADGEKGIPKALIPVMKLKIEAETQKLGAEKAKMLAEAGHANAEAQIAEAQAVAAEIGQRDLQRKEDDYLAGNKFHHIYTFNDSVNSSSVGSCISQLNIWSRQDPGCDIEVIFNSPGGGVIDGMSLFDYFQTLRRKGHKLTTVAFGMAASMAGILLQAGDVRVIGAESYVLIHEISTMAIGKIGEIEDVVKFCKLMQKRVLNIFADRSKKPVSYFQAHWKRQDWWLDSAECLELGIVDEIR